MKYDKNQIHALIVAAFKEMGFDQKFLPFTVTLAMGTTLVESGWDSEAKNPDSSAYGLGQIIDGTRAYLRTINPSLPSDSDYMTDPIAQMKYVLQLIASGREKYKSQIASRITDVIAGNPSFAGIHPAQAFIVANYMVYHVPGGNPDAGGMKASVRLLEWLRNEGDAVFQSIANTLTGDVVMTGDVGNQISVVLPKTASRVTRAFHVTGMPSNLFELDPSDTPPEDMFEFLRALAQSGAAAAWLITSVKNILATGQKRSPETSHAKGFSVDVVPLFKGANGEYSMPMNGDRPRFNNNRMLLKALRTLEPIAVRHGVSFVVEDDHMHLESRASNRMAPGVYVYDVFKPVWDGGLEFSEAATVYAADEDLLKPLNSIV